MTGIIRAAVDRLRVPERVDSFATQNDPVWDAYHQPTGSKDRWVFIDHSFTYHEAIFKHGIFGNHLAAELNAPRCRLLDTRTDRQARRAVESYGYDEVLFLQEARWMPSKTVRALTDAVALYLDLGDIEDLKTVTYNGVLLGDLVYNTYLRRTGETTLRTLDTSVFRYLFQAVHLARTFQEFFDTHPPAALVSGDIKYSRCGVPARLAVDRDVDVFVPMSNIGFSRMCSLRDLQRGRMMPAEGCFRPLFSKHRDTMVDGGDAYLEERLSDNLSDADASLAYGSDNHHLEEEDLYTGTPLNADNPTVAVMSHVFTDAPLQGDYMLFKDYHTWLEETLKFAVQHSGVNWVVKEHPATERYGCNQFARDVVDEATDSVRDHSVYMLPDGINTASLAEFSDAVVTVRGTAGLEFACQGIPPILAGHCRYAGEGFTYEPHSQDAYFELLRNADALDPLNADQRDTAKAMLYLLRVLMQPESDLIPNWQTYDDQLEVWADAGNLISTIDPTADSAYETLHTFITSDQKHTIDFQKLDHPTPKP